MTYPEECPVFEVVSPPHYTNRIRHGAIVEGAGVCRLYVRPGEWGPVYDDGSYLSVYVDRSDVIMAAVNALEWQRVEECGYAMGAVRASGLRPLTRAAREMLALVTS